MLIRISISFFGKFGFVIRSFALGVDVGIYQIKEFENLSDAKDEINTNIINDNIKIIRTGQAEDINESVLREDEKRVSDIRKQLVVVSDEDSEPDSDIVAMCNEAMDDELGTPAATAVIFDAVREANRHLDENNSDEAASAGCAVETLVDVLGLKIGRDQRPSASEDSDLDDDKIEGLIAERNQARENGDYARADEIRDDLLESGIVLEDSAQGTTWHRS